MEFWLGSTKVVGITLEFGLHLNGRALLQDLVSNINSCVKFWFSSLEVRCFRIWSALLSVVEVNAVSSFFFR